MDATEPAWRFAYEAYALWGLTDPNAPVKASGEAQIEATPQQVWDVLSDVKRWPRLRPDIDGVEIDGQVETGRSCRLTTTGVDLVLVFGRISPSLELNWVTSMPGLVMTNRYVLVPRRDATTLVAAETLTAPGFPQFTDAALADRIHTWISAVKAVAEMSGRDLAGSDDLVGADRGKAR